jgi:hypothetical protein
MHLRPGWRHLPLLLRLLLLLRRLLLLVCLCLGASD